MKLFFIVLIIFLFSVIGCQNNDYIVIDTKSDSCTVLELDPVFEQTVFSIKDIVDTTTIGFKYFDLKDVTGLRIKTRGYINGDFKIKTSLDGETLGKISVSNANIWTAGECRFSGKLSGTHALYLVFSGDGLGSLKSIEFLH